MLQGKSTLHVVYTGIVEFAQSLMLSDVLDALQSTFVELPVENPGLDF